MNLITCEELKRKLDGSENFKLVNALEPEKFRAMHIPGSLNVFQREDIPKFLHPDDEIVVYCTDDTCNKSVTMYYLLESLGFKKIFRFPGGIRAWQEAGYKMEGERVQ
ncbi:MAG TPA: rhodanese-like domain-containing protein [Chitinophagales bacterium]|nr:rhodanese-like domain-containing protein [Chitinophagales bacterium]